MEQNEKNLQQRVRVQIMDLISRMNFEYSTKLLSENQLAAKLQVSRSTIRTVLAELETEGKIIRRHGSGTYVNPPALNARPTLRPNMDMFELIEKNGYRPSMKILEVQETTAGLYAAQLNVESYTRILEMHSVYYADNVPCMYCVDRMDAARFTGVNWMQHEAEQGSIHEFIRRRADINIVWDIIRIKAATTDQLPGLQKSFGIPAGMVKPLALLEITNFDGKNEVALLGNIYIDTDLIQLNIVREMDKL